MMDQYDPIATAIELFKKYLEELRVADQWTDNQLELVDGRLKLEAADSKSFWFGKLTQKIRVWLLQRRHDSLWGLRIGIISNQSLFRMALLGLEEGDCHEANDALYLIIRNLQKNTHSETKNKLLKVMVRYVYRSTLRKISRLKKLLDDLIEIQDRRNKNK